MTEYIGKAKILICDDEVIIATELASRLKNLGYTICAQVTSGEQALELVEQHQPDLVMMDIVIHGEMDGIDAAEVIKTRWGIPVVFLTAYADTDRLDRAKLTYPFGYLLKPFQDRDLKITVEMALYVAKVDGEKKKVEKSLEEANMDLRLAQKIANIGNWSLDPELGRPEWSDHVYEIYERSPEDGPPSLEDFKKIYSDEHLDIFWNAIQAAINDGISYDIKLLLNLSIGRSKWVHAICEPSTIKGPKGHVLKGTIQDITDRKQKEDELRDSEQNHRIIFENSPLGMIFFDSEGTIVNCNDTFVKLMGSTREKLIGFNTARQSTPDMQEAIKRALSGNTAIYEDKYTSITGGKTLDLRVVFNPVTPDHNPTPVIATLEDITDRKKAENALKESEEQFRATFDEAGIGMAIVNPTGTLMNVNSAMVEMLGYSNDELTKMKFKDITHPNDIEKDISLASELFAGKRTKYQLEKRYVQKNGKVVWGRLTGSLVRDTDGTPKFAVGMIENITDRKQAEETLKQYEWITEKGLVESVIAKSKEPPRYGDVTEYNTKREILDSVGKNQLSDMATDVMALLDTSLAVYESNGDYAYGVFESGWCQTMDHASFRLCNMDDTQKALSCGKWLCHENCWNDSAKSAIESGRPTDIECVGGLHLYGVPIFAGDEIVGVVNIGYGNPSRDEQTLLDLSKKYNLDLELLRSKANTYKPRPNFIIELGKSRCRFMAQMIGDIIERKQVEIEREKLIVELQNALSEIHKLQGFLPICAHCKNIRDDEGYWQQIEKYISDRTKTQFSHSICPDCMQKLYPEYCRDNVKHTSGHLRK